jgi:hypothetical protein
MSARDELIAHAKAQRDAEIDGLIAKIEELRVLEGFALLRSYDLAFRRGEDGFEQAAWTACMLLDGEHTPVEIESVHFAPTEEQHEAVKLHVAWGEWRRRGSTGVERRVSLLELERCWSSAAVMLKSIAGSRG